MKRITPHLTPLLLVSILATFAGIFIHSTFTPKAFAQSNSAKANYISNFRTAYANIINADAQLDVLVKEGTQIGYTIVDNDFTGANAGITAANFNAAFIQAQNWHTAFTLGAAVGGGAPATLPSGISTLFQKVAK